MNDPSTEVPHPFASATDLEAALGRLGHQAFRAGQRQAIEVFALQNLFGGGAPASEQGLHAVNAAVFGADVALVAGER